MYTLQREIRPTCHIFSTLSLRMALDHMYPTRFTYSNLSRSHQPSWTGSLLPRKKRIPDYILSTPDDRSVGPHPVSLSPHKHRSSEESHTTFNNKLLGLLDSYISMRSVHSILAHGSQPIGP
jgi:hypothetical protein